MSFRRPILTTPQSSAKKVAIGGLVAGCYIALTLLSNAFGLGSGVFQVRLSEALCILPCFSVAAIPGLFAGCALSNLISGGGLIDLAIGGAATLIGAIGTYIFRRHRYLAVLPPIVANTFIIPIVLRLAYGINDAYPQLALIMFASELISCGLLGELLYTALKRRIK